MTLTPSEWCLSAASALAVLGGVTWAWQPTLRARYCPEPVASEQRRHKVAAFILGVSVGCMVASALVMRFNSY
jgi:hypothetical protein